MSNAVKTAYFPVSRKIVVGFLTAAVMWGIVFTLGKLNVLGWMNNTLYLETVPAAVGWAVGAVTGWLAKEWPDIFSKRGATR